MLKTYQLKVTELCKVTKSVRTQEREHKEVTPLTFVLAIFAR